MSKASSNDIKAIIETFDDSDWEEFHFKSDELEINLSKKNSIRRSADQPVAAPVAVAASPGPAAAAPVPDAATPGQAAIPDRMVAIRAPNLGTFYRAPKPGAPPYVEVGQAIGPDTQVCLIEIMKLFTPVTAGISGVVREVLVKDGAVVEFDQPLILLEPGAQ